MEKKGKEQALQFDPHDTLLAVSQKLVASTEALMRTARTEEDLRVGFEKILEPLFGSLGIKGYARYEKTIYAAGRADALHGQVILEYESPGSFSSPATARHAFDQLVGYIEGMARERRDTLFLLDPKFVGVGFDGREMFFVRYQGDKNRLKIGLDPKDFVLLGPYLFHQDTARTFLTHVRALSRRLLTAENLSQVFGPQSAVAPLVVSALTDAMENWSRNPRVRTFLNEWKRLFGIIYGQQFQDQKIDEAVELARLYGVKETLDFQILLFSVHTYFVFLMKLIAAELLNYYEVSFKSSFSDDLVHSDKNTFLAKLEEIEEGGVYARRGITNFLEGDFFRWYLDAFSPRLEEALRETARAFSEFEFATTTLDPKASHDLLKKLYQYLVPQDIRHKLGEYYTPDWLAELVLEETGYDGNIRRRVLDPACGSGTFLVEAIQKARKYAQAHREPPLETAKNILTNIWGFDLNPLAVIAARTNYLFAIGDLTQKMDQVEIPVYLADSVLWPEKAGQLQLNFAGGQHLRIQTSVGPFHVPYIWTDGGGFLLKQAAPLTEMMVKQNYSVAEALKKYKQAGLVFPPHEAIVSHFYEELLELEKQEKNGIWARFLKNIFAPTVAKKFDFVVGNPPWIRWGYLSEEYRAATLPMWKSYGLFSLKGHAARLGGGEKDFSMLFTYAVADYYLADGGTLGFLITQEVFKSKGAGEGFRRFRLGDESPLKVIKAHDLVSVQPFEGAANKTAALILEKGAPTRYPVPYTLWSRKRGVGKISTEINLEEALPFLQSKKLLARPMGSPTGSWQTLSRAQKGLEKIQGKNPYQARRGASTDPYGVYWLEIADVLSKKELIVNNLPELGKRKIQKIQERIESDLVFPAVRGADIERWGVWPKIYVLMVQDPQKCAPYPQARMKNDWPRTFGYLTRFKDVLLSRGSKTVRQFAQRTEFYAMFGIGPYTVSRYKVIWKRMAGDLIAAVVSQFKTPFGFKMIIPTDTTALFATENETEAHYLCAVLNSVRVREFIQSYSSAGRGFGAPSVMNHLGIPRFQVKKSLQAKLAELSLKLHEAREAGRLFEIAEGENEIDELVKKLFEAEE